MKNIITLSILLLSLAIQGQNIISVNGNPANGSSDYTTIQAAIDAANPGDIVQIYPGDYPESVTLAKPLYLQGVGYLLEHNYPNHDWSNPHSYISTSLSINADAETSMIEGLNIRDLNVIGADDIHISRSRVQRGYFDECENIIFHSCYMGGWYYDNLDTQYQLHKNVHLLFENCLIPDGYSSVARDYIFRVHSAIYVGSITLNQCIFRNYLLTYAPYYTLTVSNSIGLTSYGAQVQNVSAGSLITNCLFERASSLYASSSNNLFNIVPTDEFIGYGSSGSNGYSFDKQYELLTSSQAIGYATDGGDCGIFGGNKPYVLSGIPTFPFIYGFEADQHGSTGGGIDVNIQVKSQN